MTCLPSPHRHAELVSASIVPQAKVARGEEWTLKQVQGDGVLLTVQVQKLLAIRLDGSVG